MDVLLLAKALEQHVEMYADSPVAKAHVLAQAPQAAAPPNSPPIGAPLVAVEGPKREGITASNVLYHIIGICIGAYAAYLSWQCNTAIGTNMPLKVLFAVLAYIFGFFYLICYFIFLSTTCGVKPVSPYSR